MTLSRLPSTLLVTTTHSRFQIFQCPTNWESTYGTNTRMKVKEQDSHLCISVFAGAVRFSATKPVRSSEIQPELRLVVL